jgi:hypothetical protein
MSAIRGQPFGFILKSTASAGRQISAVNNALLVVDNFMQHNRFTSQFSALLKGCILLHPEDKMMI